MKLRAFWNESQSTGFGYCFSEALFILLCGAFRSIFVGLASSALLSFSLCFDKAGLQGNRTDSFLPRQACPQCSRDKQPLFLQCSADSESPGEKTSEEKSWKGNILPRVHHLTCLQHPEQPGQGYSPCHHCQPRRAEEWCRACLLLLPLSCSEQQ